MEKMLIKVYKNKTLSSFLKILCHLISLIFVVAFCAELAIPIYKKAYLTMLTVPVSAAVGFVTVSAVRRLIDAPRPYELYAFYEEKPKNKKGSSFPSRHVYSAFAIATLAFLISNPVAIILLALALVMSAIRVLLGIHFIRDVAAGALIGIITGAVGIVLTLI